MSWAAIGAATITTAGGFLGGSKKSEQKTNEYSNPTLGSYANGYMQAAPWGFASLDPTSTLAAMSQGAFGGKSLGGGTEKLLEGLSADERRQEQDTRDALNRIKTRQESGQFITPRETDFINQSLDKAFEYAHKTGYEDWTKATQMMAGRRGLRMSDTPVAEPALKELRNFELGLGSKRAEAGLSATLGMGQSQQAFDESFAQFNQSLALNRMQARQGYLFGGGMQGAGNIAFKGMSSGMTADNPGMLSNLGKSMDIGGKYGQILSSGLSSAFKGLGSLFNTPDAERIPASGTISEWV